MRALSPREFEHFIAELVAQLGFDDVKLTCFSGDGGRDVIATKVVHGLPISFFFECKKHAPENKVQVQTLRALLGVIAHNSHTANIGVLVTTSQFTRGSKEIMAAECRLSGKDYDGIVDWLREFRRGKLES
jgi:restriction endonuclease Mrr